MSRFRLSEAGRCLFAGLLVLGGRSAVAQSSWDEYEPHWLRLEPPKASLGAEVEGLRENIRSSTAGDSSHEHYSVTPLVGLKLDGFVFHPNLLSFDLNGEGGLGYAVDRISSPGFNQTRHENLDVERYDVLLHLLDAKPYHANFFAAQNHFYRNYDFFNTSVVDTKRYGGRMDWRVKNIDLNAEVGHREERTSGLNGTSRFEDTYVNFNAQHQREHGSTSLSYYYDDLSQLSSGIGSQNATHAIYLSDVHTFGSRNQITATTAGGYSVFDYRGPRTETFTASENITAHHSDTLESYAYGNYRQTDQSPAASSVFQGAIGVRQRSWQDLLSTLEVHGMYDDFSGIDGSGSNDRYGIELQEDYTHPLSPWARLSLGGAAVGDHEDRNVAGTVLSVPYESYSVYAPGAGHGNNFLKNPNVVLTTIQVRTSGGLLVPQPGNYLVITHGVQTEIQRVPGSPLLTTDGQSVIVSYNYVAPPTASYEVLNLSGQIRLDLFDTFGVYGRASWLDNNAPPQAMVQTLTDLVGGADAHWRWARAGAEYEDYNSNYARYKAWRFYQALSFHAGDASNLGFNFNQVFYRYAQSQGGDETQYQFMAQFDTQLTSWLNWNVEGGYYLREISGMHDNMAAARTGLSAAWGKLTVRAGYQYNRQEIDQGLSKEERGRNFFYFYLRRVF